MKLREAMLRAGGQHTEYREPGRTVNTYINVDIERAEYLYLNDLPWHHVTKKSWVPDWLWKLVSQEKKYLV